MTKSNRILLLGLGFEAVLAAIWAWLMSGIASGELSTSLASEEAAATVSSVLGGAMGLFGALVLTIWFVLRKKGQ